MSGGPAAGAQRLRVRAAPAVGQPRLGSLVAPPVAWVLVEAAEPGPPAALGARLAAMLGGVEPGAAEWTARLAGPADQVRYLVEIGAAEGLEAVAGPGDRRAELHLAAGHPLATTLLGTPETRGCTVVLTAAAAAVAVPGGAAGRWGLLGSAGGTAPALAAAAAAGAAVDERPRAIPEPDRRRPHPGLVGAGAIVVLAAAAAVWATAPVRTGPDPRLQVGPAPQAREQVAAAVDPRRGELVLFGGSADSPAGTDLGDTWTRTAAGWQAAHPAASPSARFGAVMAADPGAGTVVLFGGRRRTAGRAETLDDTWSWDGATWTRRDPASTPPAGAVARALAYDAAARTLVLVTEGPEAAATWTWEQGGWAAHPDAGTPVMRWMAAAPDGAVIAVGPPDAANRGATWRWDGRRWERRAPPTAVRVEPLSALLAFDPAGRRTLLVEVEFQGTDGTRAGGTWSWDGATWTEHHSAPAVVAAFGATAPVVAGDRPLVLVGGPQDGGAYRDAWEWDGSTWRRS